MRRAIVIVPILVVGLMVWLVVTHSATQTPAAVDPQGPGFLSGALHGFIFPFAFIGSLISDRIAVYAVPNAGLAYDLGFFVGIVVLGGGAGFGGRSR